MTRGGKRQGAGGKKPRLPEDQKKVMISTRISQENDKFLKERKQQGYSIAGTIEEALEGLRGKNTNVFLMPEALTAENGAKKLLIGEFFEEVKVDCCKCYGDGCDECEGRGHYVMKVPVQWTTIKAIYAKTVEYFKNEQRKGLG